MANYSISFNGSTQYAQVSTALFDPTVPWTIEAYVKLNAEITTDEYRLVSFENNTQKWDVRLRYEYNSGTQRLYFSTARWVLIGFQAVHNIALGTSNWVHVAMTRSSTSVKCYVNGVHVGSTGTITDNDDGTTATNTQLVVGAGTTTGTSTYIKHSNTKMACLRIWSDVRTDAELLANKDTIITGTADNLIGSWYNGVEDHSDDSQTNNLTAVNSPTFVEDFPFTTVTTETKNNSVKASIVATDSINNNTKASIVTTSSLDNNVKANIITIEVDDNNSKASLVTTNSNDNNTKSNILTIGNTKDNLSKANIIKIESQNNSVKANIITTYYCGHTYDWTIDGENRGKQ